MKHAKQRERAWHLPKEKSRRNVVYILILTVLGCVMVFSGWKIAKTLLQYREGEKTYSGVEESFATVAGSEDDSSGNGTSRKKNSSADEKSEDDEDDGVPITVDMQKLRASWPNAVGWIYAEDTVISYPVMQSEEDNLYYVEHLYNDEWNPGGAIFMDFRNDSAFQDSNSILYGHHMNDGSMFASLVKYEKEGYYEEHPVMWLVTLTGTYRLDIFSGFVTPATSDIYARSFDSEEEFSNWLSYCQSQSNFVSTVTPTTQDHILTLSTCTYDYDDARYVVQAVMTKVDTEV